MIGKECKHIQTEHLGKIIRELEGDKLKPQWGIYWYSGIDGKQHAEKVKKDGIPTHWIDKDRITIL